MPGQKIKILHLVKSLGRGGAETLLVETAKLHDRQKVELHVIYFLPWKNQLVHELESLGVKVTNLPVSNNIQLISRFRIVESYMLNHDINILHCHLPWAGFLGRLIYKRTKISVIYSEHNKQERYHFITRFVNRFTFNFQSQVIAVSHDVRHSILKNIPVEIPVATISNGVDTDLYSQNDEIREEKRLMLGFSEKELVIGTVAVFRKQKCLLNWLDVFASLYEKHKNIRGVMVGDGPMMVEIKAHIKKLGLTSVVHLPGMQSKSADWYNIMDIFMISSEFEGLPLVLLEAMSSEKPVVTTNAGGIKEVVINKETGYLLEFGDWSGMTKAVDELIRNPELRLAMGQSGRQRVINEFSLLNMVRSLENLYQQNAN